MGAVDEDLFRRAMLELDAAARADEDADAALEAALASKKKTALALQAAADALRALYGVPLLHHGEDDWINTGEAARIARRSKDTMARWADEKGIGRRVAGRWLLSRRALLATLNRAA